MNIAHITILANGHGLVTYSDGTIETVHTDDITIVEPTEVPENEPLEVDEFVSKLFGTSIK